jgi:predicted metal-dependent HD superfamily phosphohydrolase
MNNPFNEYKSLLIRYLQPEFIVYVERAWNEPHRKYHNIEHLKSVIKYINKFRFELPPSVYDALILAAFFHDVYYNPRDNKNNEDESIKRFLVTFSGSKQTITKKFIVQTTKEADEYKPYKQKKNTIQQKQIHLKSPDDNNIRNLVVAMIESTKHRKVPTNPVIRLFWEADNSIFFEGLNQDYEKLIREEFKHVPVKVYKKKRIEFLKSNIGLFKDAKVDEGLNDLIKYVGDKY